MQTWHSEDMKRSQYIISTLTGGLFASLFVFVIIRYFAEDGGWIMRFDQPIISFLIIYLIGIIAAGLYFYKDHSQFKQQTLELKGTHLTFKQGKKDPKSFHILEMRTHKFSRTIYGWFGYRKVMLQFKSNVDFRRYQYLLLIKSNEEKKLLDALKESHKNAVGKQKAKH